MKIGKLPEPILIRSVLKQVKHRREEVLVGPAVGQDCAIVQVEPDDSVRVSYVNRALAGCRDLGSLVWEIRSIMDS